MAIKWDDAERVFQHDEGWFCDVSPLAGRGDDGWQRLLDLVRSRGWHFRYSEDGAERRLPDIRSIRTAQQQRSPLLVVDPPSCPSLRFHFFSPEQVEATFDPLEVRDQSHLKGS